MNGPQCQHAGDPQHGYRSLLQWRCEDDLVPLKNVFEIVLDHLIRIIGAIFVSEFTVPVVLDEDPQFFFSFFSAGVHCGP